MAGEKGFKSIEELVKGLAGKVGELAVGSVNVKDIELMCDESRELYERLVVLRHRGREAMLDGETNIAVEQNEQESPKKEEESSPAPPPMMTLDFAPEPSTPVQTSLLDTVKEETKPAEPKVASPVSEEAIQTQSNPVLETPAPVSEAVQQPAETKPVTEAPVTIAEKLESAPIEDIGAAIGLNQKFMFISQIFNGKKDAYANAISQLNTMQDADSANSLANQLTAHMSHDDEEQQQAKKQFLDLIERRFQ